jgi:hypothetical protein
MSLLQDTMTTRRSTRSTPRPLAADEEIYVRADVLGAAQWRALDLSPRTGWVRGVVAPRRQPAAAARPTVASAAAEPRAPRGDDFDVLVKVDVQADGVRVARLPLRTAGGASDTPWSREAPAAATPAPDLVTLEPLDAEADASTLARLLAELCPAGTKGTPRELHELMHAAALDPRDVFALVRVSEADVLAALERASAAADAEWSAERGGRWKRRLPPSRLQAGQRALLERAAERRERCVQLDDEIETHVCGLRDLVGDDVVYAALPKVQRLEQAIALVLAELVDLEARMRNEGASPLLASVRAEGTPFRGGRNGHRRQLLETRWKLEAHPKPKMATVRQSPEAAADRLRDSHVEPHGSPVVALLRCRVHAGQGCGYTSRDAVAFCADARAVLRELVASVDDDARAMRLLIKQMGQLTDATFALTRNTGECLRRTSARAAALSSSMGLQQLRRYGGTLTHGLS